MTENFPAAPGLSANRAVDVTGAIADVTGATVPRASNSPLKAIVGVLKNIAVGASGFVLVGVLWQILAQFRDLPGVFSIAHELGLQPAHPFRSDDVNDLGIGLLTFHSLFRVCAGFALGTLVAVPMGFALGSVPLVKRAFSPVIETLRPISLIAWIPIGTALAARHSPAQPPPNQANRKITRFNIVKSNT